MKYSIDVTADSRYPVDRKRIRVAISRVLRSFGVSGPVGVSVRVVGDRKMKQLNRDYRKKAEATNVLSFPTESLQTKGEGFVYPEEEPFPLGDVVISYPQARLAAVEKSVLVDDEVVALVEHGVKSLLGQHES